jgi:cytosine deaminase
MARDVSANLFLTNTTLQDGAAADIRVGDGVIAAVAAPGALPAPDNVASIDLAGYLLLPAPAEPHAHLDKSLLGDRVPNISGDLMGAIDAIRLDYPSMSVADIQTRALKAVSVAISRGFTEVRTHVNCGNELAIRGVEALVGVRDHVRNLVGVQLVALSESPITGDEGAANRRALQAALDLGVDLVGGAPAIDPDPVAAVHLLLQIAAESGTDLDLHIDESTDPSAGCLHVLAKAVLETGFTGRVTASHCVSLGAQDPGRCREIAELVAVAGISVVTLPQTNLYLQGRAGAPNQLRGLTAIRELRAAGVAVAAGGDNWRDPFNPLGRIDPLETASLMVVAGHLLPHDAYSAVSDQARAAMGLPVVRIEPGYPADLLAIKATSLVDAVADASEQRTVVRAGRIVARTEVHTELAEAFRFDGLDYDAAAGCGGPLG